MFDPGAHREQPKRSHGWQLVRQSYGAKHSAINANHSSTDRHSGAASHLTGSQSPHEPSKGAGSGEHNACWRQLQRVAHALAQLVDTNAFSTLITVLILINVGIMMCEQYPMDPQLAAHLEMANGILVGLFALEMVLKHVGLGPAAYWSDGFNRFDGIVVLTSLLDVASALVDMGVNSQTLRAFRLLRVFKLVPTPRTNSRD